MGYRYPYRLSLTFGIKISGPEHGDFGRATSNWDHISHDAPARFSTCADLLQPLLLVSDSQPHATEDLHNSSPASRQGRGTAMVSVGVAASVWLGAGRVGATSSISRALGSMPCHAMHAYFCTAGTR